MNRRSFLLGLAAGLAPAVIRTPGLLMPVRSILQPTAVLTHNEALQASFQATKEDVVYRYWALAQVKIEGYAVAFDDPLWDPVAMTYRDPKSMPSGLSVWLSSNQTLTIGD